MKKLVVTVMCMCLVVGAAVLLTGCKDKSDTPAASDMDNMMEKAEKTADTMVEKTDEMVDKAEEMAGEQTTCPVMKGPIDKEIFVEYKGKKVYFCCASCKAEFDKDPEKYVKDLPQFK